MVICCGTLRKLTQWIQKEVVETLVEDWNL